MKKILLSIFILAIVGLSTKVQAQCTVKNLAIKVNSINTTTCEVSFDISFEQEINSGNKFAYIHLWAAAAYHTPSAEWTVAKDIYGGPSKAPMAAQLVNALATIAIEFNGTATPTIGNIYYPDGTVIPKTAGLTITKTIVDGVTERETIKGLVLIVPNCTGTVPVKGDIWASQAQNGKNVHCATQNLTFNLNDPQIISAFKVCNPRSLTFGIRNNGTSTIQLSYKIYKDDGDGSFEPGVGAGLDGNAIITSSVLPLDPGATRSEFQLPFPGNDVGGENASYWLQVIAVGVPFTPIALMSNDEAGCSPLPVKLKTFTASRKQTNVELKWTTTAEQNNSGFELQRQSGAGGWQRIGFVNSKATDGNSTSDLNYTYTDANDSRGVSQYRLMQVDHDDNAKYSDIRSVQGIGQEARTIISPNPSANGRVNVTFQSASSKKDLQLTDMNGRMLKQWNAYSDNSLQITDLTPGIYQLRITDRETGTQTVEKIMVVNR